MSTAEEEDRRVSLISEVPATPKSNSVKLYSSNFSSREHEVNELGDIISDTCIRDFHHALVKSNSVLNCGKLTNHSGGEDGEITENDEFLKLNSNFNSAKKVELDGKEHDGKKLSNKPTQIVLTAEQLSSLSKEEFAEKWTQQNKYIISLRSSLEAALLEVSDLKKSRLSDERLKSQLSELQRKEQYHVMRLATKEHDIQELVAQVEELKNLTAGGNSVKNCLLDPAVNLLFERMKRDFDSAKAKMEETQNELAAWKFTPDSNTGKQLMAKCRLLIKENEELGKMISSGRLAKLEGELALQRSFSDELKKSQSEMDEFLQEMDEDTEGMQGTIVYLQSQLRLAKEKISHLSNQINALGQSTSNNNTPASGRDGPDYIEDPFSETDPQNEDSLQRYSEEGRNLLESVDDKISLKEIDQDYSNEAATPGTKPNGDLMANLKCNFSGSGDSTLESKDYPNAHAHFKAISSGRKRTQCTMEGEGHDGNGEDLRDRLTPPTLTNKRTRVDNDGMMGIEGGVSELVVENGLTMKQ